MAHSQLRVAFSGANNVTLRGTTDTEWGWVDGHGQAVSSVLLPSSVEPLYSLYACSGGMQYNKPIVRTDGHSARSITVLSGI